ncbi:MAG: protein kinase domain-containing protein [Gemmatimonadales bacterium]
MAAPVVDDLAQLQAALSGRYAIDREIGRGGMARVYLARDLRHDRDVALKVLRPELAASLGADRFLREIRIEARLQHPHILPLHDSGIAGGRLYYVMPYVAGETLRDRLGREKQLSLADAVRIACEIADALSHAHANNIVHRDIKPGNILLSGGHAVVADFGIARAMTVAAEEQVTDAGLAIGTADYMSPEQASGAYGLDGRSDVYALGCVLYEMLAGEPPFRGRTTQAILARHLHEPPPPLRIRRPNLPEAVEDAVAKALAKVPADRFATAAEFAEALRAAEASGGPSRVHRSARRAGPRVIALGAVALLALMGVWALLRGRSPELDRNRMVVFPLDEALTGSPDGSGEAVATYIGYALEGTAPLRWLEGRDFLDPSRRHATGAVPAMEARRISRAQRAGFYVDGSIVKTQDSVTVVLRLHDVSGDSILRRAGASSRAADASLPQLGLGALGQLLPALLEPGRRVDLTALSDRRPTAIANFLQGEREYRRMRFAPALEHYRMAVAEDSALAIAALKGALAATWPGVSDEGDQLIAVALRHEAFLPPRLALFARGWRHYRAGNADSAAAHFRRAVAIDPGWPEAWMALAEVYYHLVPQAPSLDSLAEAALLEARRADSSFTPPLYHLAEIALLAGDRSEGEVRLAQLRRADPDSEFSRRLSLMVDCVRKGPSSVAWGRAAELGPSEVLGTAQMLAARGAQPGCARRGFEAVLRSAHTKYRWGALLGLQSLLAAEGRSDDLARLFASGPAAQLPARRLYLLNAAAGTGFEAEAAAVAAEWGRQYDSISGPTLWMLAEWAASRGDVEALRSIAAVTAARAAHSGTREDSLFARVVAAHSARARGDSAAAIGLLSALVPTASPRDLMWQPWEALAGERLALAELLFARGRLVDADRIAEEVESHRAIVYLIYLPASLQLRARMAEAMGRPDRAAIYRGRSAALRREIPASSVTGS